MSSVLAILLSLWAALTCPPGSATATSIVTEHGPSRPGPVLLQIERSDDSSAPSHTAPHRGRTPLFEGSDRGSEPFEKDACDILGFAFGWDLHCPFARIWRFEVRGRLLANCRTILPILRC